MTQILVFYDYDKVALVQFHGDSFKLKSKLYLHINNF